MDNSVFSCSACGTQVNHMKRCTRCKYVYYCSRECQVADWPSHRSNCRTDTGQCTNDTEQERTDTGQGSDAHDTSSIKTAVTSIHNGKQNVTDNGTNCEKQNSSFYLRNNEFKYDAPQPNPNEKNHSVNLKFNKRKQKTEMCNTWTGEEIWKYLALTTNIPYEAIIVIYKGRKLTAETIAAIIKDKITLLVLGEVAEDETGVDSEEIQILMKQMTVSRKDAVKAMKKCGNLVDAILDVGSK